MTGSSTPPAPASAPSSGATPVSKDRRPRPPRMVRRAAMVVVLTAVVGLVQGINARLEQGILADGVKRAGDYMSVDQAIYVTGGLRGSLGLAFPAGMAVFAIGLLLAYPLLRGRRWARSTLWITGIAFIMTELILTGADAAVNTGNYVRDVDVPGGDPDVVAMVNDMLVPGWFLPVHYLTEFLVVVLVGVACVQIALPSSLEYFRAVNFRTGDEETGRDDHRIWTLPAKR